MEFLIDYLPYSRSVEIRNAQIILKSLKTLLFLLNNCLYAIKAYENRLYHLFDPQVSENLCQIRSLKNCILFESGHYDFFCEPMDKKKKLIDGYKRHVEMVYKTIVDDHRNQKRQKFSFDKHETIQNYMRKLFFDMRFDKFLEYITFSFILTKYSLIGEDGISQGIDYKLLSSDLGIDSITYSSKVVHKLQRILSHRSIDFMFELIEKNGYRKSFWDMMKFFYQKDEVQRHVLPCYYVTNIILKHISIFYQELPILICVLFEDNTSLILPFYLNESGYFYSSSPLKEENMNRECFVIEGVVKGVADRNKEEWKSNFLSSDLLEIIRMNMAAHPQYSGRKLQALKKNPFLISRERCKKFEFAVHENNADLFLEEDHFLKDQENADLMGCSIENSSLFLIKHIYSASPKYLFEKYGELLLYSSNNLQVLS